MRATSWLPNDNFDNDGNSLDGFPMFLDDQPYEIIWSYQDNTQEVYGAQKMETFYEVIKFNAGDAAILMTKELSLGALVIAIAFYGL